LEAEFPPPHAVNNNTVKNKAVKLSAKNRGLNFEFIIIKKDDL